MRVSKLNKTKHKKKHPNKTKHKKKHPIKKQNKSHKKSKKRKRPIKKQKKRGNDCKINIDGIECYQTSMTKGNCNYGSINRTLRYGNINNAGEEMKAIVCDIDNKMGKNKFGHQYFYRGRTNPITDIEYISPDKGYASCTRNLKKAKEFIGDKGTVLMFTIPDDIKTHEMSIDKEQEVLIERDVWFRKMGTTVHDNDNNVYEFELTKAKPTTKTLARALESKEKMKIFDADRPDEILVN